MGLIGTTRWPGELPAAPFGRGPVRDPAAPRARGFAVLHEPAPELVDGRPRVIRASVLPLSDIGTLNWASPATAILAYLTVLLAGAAAARGSDSPLVFVTMMGALLVGIVWGRYRWRGRFTGLPGVAVAGVTLLATGILGALLFAIVGLVMPVWLAMFAVPVCVAGLDWGWAQRLRWSVLAAAVVLAAAPALGRNPPVPLLLALLVVVAVFLWSVQRDIVAGARRLRRLSGFAAPPEDRAPFELTIAFVVAAVLALLVLPLLIIPALSWDFRSPSLEGRNIFSAFFDWILRGLDFVVAPVLRWLESLFGDAPQVRADVPGWLQWIFDRVRDVRHLVAPVFAWVVPKIPYLIAAVIVAYLVTRTVRSRRRWHAELAARRWGARMADRLEAAARIRGHRRRRNETLLELAFALRRESVPDDRIVAVATLATASCFAPTEIDAAQRDRADQLFAQVLAEHPAPALGERMWRGLGARGARR